MMRARVLQHAPFEGIGCIERWLQQHGAIVDTTRLFAGDAVPSTANDIDLLIAMGGPMSVNDEQALPWLVPEKHLVKDAIANGVPTVGICLGAQLIASALGARVYPNAEREIGWFPVRPVAAAASADTFRFADELITFHWHGETFDLPAGATHLAESDGCRHQAFAIGRHAIGVQFHPEMTLSGARLLVEHCPSDLKPGRYVQTDDVILAGDATLVERGHLVMAQILDFIVGGRSTTS